MKGTKPITWTSDMDIKIRELRELGKPWDEVADAIGVNRVTLIEHAKTALGLPSKVQRRGYTCVNRVYRPR